MLKRIMFCGLVGCFGLNGTALAEKHSCRKPDVGSFVTLGTNAGPVANNPRRGQPANYLTYQDTHVLVDVGDGATEALGKVGLVPAAISAIMISHLHSDHTGGLFAFLHRRYQTEIYAPLTIYGPAGIEAMVEGLIAGIRPMAENSDFAANASPDPASGITVVELGNGDQFELDAIEVTVATNTHYVVTDPADDLEQSLSFRFDLPERSIVYTGDTGPSDQVEQLAAGADLLFSEVMDPDATLAIVRQTAPDLPEAALEHLREHFTKQHLTPTEAGLLAERAGVRRLVLTHVGVPDSELNKARWEVDEAYSGPFNFANDFDTH